MRKRDREALNFCGVMFREDGPHAVFWNRITRKLNVSDKVMKNDEAEAKSISGEKKRSTTSRGPANNSEHL
jgi:hypothetical protein